MTPAATLGNDGDLLIVLISCPINRDQEPDPTGVRTTWGKKKKRKKKTASRNREYNMQGSVLYVQV